MGGAFQKHDGRRSGCARGYLIQGSGRGGKGTIILETREAIHQSTSSQPSLTEARFEEMDRAIPKRLKEDVCQRGKRRKVKPDPDWFSSSPHPRPTRLDHGLPLLLIFSKSAFPRAGEVEGDLEVFIPSGGV